MANTDEQKTETTETQELPALRDRCAFLNFPVDEYYPVCIIAYMVAPLPPNPKFAKPGDGPTPNVRFLVAGLVRNPEDGEMVTVRKWTGWKAISYADNSGLSKMFADVPNLGKILEDDKDGGKLWTTPFKVMLEASKDGKYTNITRLKLGEDKGQMGICYTAEIEKSLFKTVKAYANEVPLEVAVVKTPEGVKRYFPADLLDAPVKEEND